MLNAESLKRNASGCELQILSSDTSFLSNMLDWIILFLNRCTFGGRLMLFALCFLLCASALLQLLKLYIQHIIFLPPNKIKMPPFGTVHPKAVLLHSVD